MLADLDTVEKRAGSRRRSRPGGTRPRSGGRLFEALPRPPRARACRRRSLAVAGAAEPRSATLHLLTAKPLLFVANVDEDRLLRESGRGARPSSAAASRVRRSSAVCAKLEAELAELAPRRSGVPGERRPRRARPDSPRSRAAYALLDLITLLHRRRRRRSAPGPSAAAPLALRAAGEIHSDFEQGPSSASR